MKLPQLSLRELFLLVIIVAMGCAWWVDHERSEDSLSKAQRVLAVVLSFLSGLVVERYVLAKRQVPPDSPPQTIDSHP